MPLTPGSGLVRGPIGTASLSEEVRRSHFCPPGNGLAVLQIEQVFGVGGRECNPDTRYPWEAVLELAA